MDQNTVGLSNLLTPTWEYLYDIIISLHMFTITVNTFLISPSGDQKMLIFLWEYLC